MKGIEIQKDSWHYWLALKMGWKRYREEDNWVLTKDGQPYINGYLTVESDFCSYVRRVILGVFLLANLMLGCVIFLGMFLYFEFMAWRANIICWVYHECTFGKDAAFGNAMNVLILAIALMILLMVGLPKYLDHRRRIHQDAWMDPDEVKLARRKARKDAKILRMLARKNKETFLRIAYRSIKDKICFRIEIK